ncbi:MULTISPECIES: ferredoxin [Mycobacteroides]|jgi:ferredoxin|uniref:Ferredoxin n=1 Tax=Mycobacteroides chelonae TaxID=1774 RepID=A0A1S1LRC7_MYCCH|nr:MULTISPECIES: ferredoxin [Mycobacteroides]KRQ19280.1 hypothetical protein AOT87_26670 [Mycobacteroides sp. H003]KRQ34521.1 hypothetical protein AOT91_06420 [Mycobacteroides sp. H092]KRQ41504.1 hypothetical protein AOT92_12190 [Mycobacteroides sp. H101]KRQ43458.1 hypothetical protein AOT88_24210 [Mycobacteroides sp. H063]KRQ58090.1 hypothetical protein AOT94_14490 [Mycobacteroides sp. HXVII]
MDISFEGNVISVDQDLCMGSGYCAREYPTLFQLDGDGVAELNTGVTLGANALHQAESAAQICPAAAIEVLHGA